MTYIVLVLSLVAHTAFTSELVYVTARESVSPDSALAVACLAPRVKVTIISSDTTFTSELVYVTADVKRYLGKQQFKGDFNAMVRPLLSEENNNKNASSTPTIFFTPENCGIKELPQAKKARTISRWLNRYLNPFDILSSSLCLVTSGRMVDKEYKRSVKLIFDGSANLFSPKSLNFSDDDLCSSFEVNFQEKKNRSDDDFKLNLKLVGVVNMSESQLFLGGKSGIINNYLTDPQIWATARS
ncbi:uncharacterized protein BX664DRAFT_358772 [Halteromyces radiatus]|uniref:uncharacterized protein n=1 Tax=Halteromyces radiatus TaxID=101107 RepID=UPI00221F9DA8|nr:uncharacterized protein BX664DRAFT_358772 [Halteromyces radiatus]KAI8089197.1 hypothetical protein BX664DRAFT_358772 [Halteromyces radiatus]